MPTPAQDDEGHALLTDAEFDAIHDLTKEEFEALPAAKREAAEWTSRWHFGQRQALAVDSMFVDGMPFGEYPKKIEAEEKEGKQD